MLENIKLHLDFNIYPVTVLAFIAAIAIIPCIMFLPEEFGFENGILENIQMVFLALSFIIAITAKINKKFFGFVALIIILITLREVNYGRTLFFPIPGEVNAYYSWKEIKYGWLVNPLVGIYIAGTFIYAIWGKAFQTIWKLLKNVKLPIWNILLLILGMFLGLYAEKATENFVFEEMAELLFYVALTGIIWLYAADEKFIIKSDD